MKGIVPEPLLRKDEWICYENSSSPAEGKPT